MNWTCFVGGLGQLLEYGDGSLELMATAWLPSVRTSGLRRVSYGQSVNPMLNPMAASQSLQLLTDTVCRMVHLRDADCSRAPLRMSQVADISFRRSKIKTAPPLPPAASLLLSIREPAACCFGLRHLTAVPLGTFLWSAGKIFGATCPVIVLGERPPEMDRGQGHVQTGGLQKRKAPLTSMRSQYFRDRALA